MKQRKPSKLKQITFSSSDSELNELETTFKFDSTMIKGKKSNPKNTTLQSKSKSFLKLLKQSQFSHRTSEMVRFVDQKNENILELLEQSDGPKTVNKIENQEHKELWDFFGRFENETHPSISLTEINLSNKDRKTSKSIPKKQQYAKKKNKLNSLTEPPQINSSDEEFSYALQTQNNAFSHRKYPHRNRLQTLRYWLGEKPIYKSGLIVGVIRKDQTNK